LPTSSWQSPGFTVNVQTTSLEGDTVSKINNNCLIVALTIGQPDRSNGIPVDCMAFIDGVVSKALAWAGVVPLTVQQLFHDIPVILGQNLRASPYPDSVRRTTSKLKWLVSNELKVMEIRQSTNLWERGLSLACGRTAADLSKSSNREYDGVLEANHDYL
jgi:hypothetical protein